MPRSPTSGSNPVSERPVAKTRCSPGTEPSRPTSLRTAPDSAPSKSTSVPSTSRPSSLSTTTGSGNGRQHIGTDVRLQRFWYDDGAVGLLVVLQDRDDPTGRGQRAVERRNDPVLALAVRVALAHPEPAGLVRRAVRGRRQLAVAALGRHPALAVELARGRTTEVAGRHVDDPVGHLDLGQHLLLEAKQPLMLGRGVLDPAPAEHLDLVELVHPDDAGRVLAIAAGLAAVAGRPAGVPQRPP